MTMANDIEKLASPPLCFSAEWADGDGRSGIDAESEKLTWWHLPNGPDGRFGQSAKLQSYEEFIARGAAVSGVPAKVMSDLRLSILNEGATQPRV